MSHQSEAAPAKDGPGEFQVELDPPYVAATILGFGLRSDSSSATEVAGMTLALEAKLCNELSVMCTPLGGTIALPKER